MARVVLFMKETWKNIKKGVWLYYSEPYPGMRSYYLDPIYEAGIEMNRASRESSRHNYPKVDLCDYALYSLPDRIGDFVKRMSELDCSQNVLTDLPKSLENCAELRKLDCSENMLTELPVWLASLPKLEVLVCDENPWDSDWLAEQGLGRYDNPTLESLKRLAERSSASPMIKSANKH